MLWLCINADTVCFRQASGQVRADVLQLTLLQCTSFNESSGLGDSLLLPTDEVLNVSELLLYGLHACIKGCQLLTAQVL